MFGGASQITTAAEHCFFVWTVHNDLITARSAVASQKLRGAAEHLIDGSEKRIWRLSFEFWSPHVIQGRSNRLTNNPAQVDKEQLARKTPWERNWL